MFSCYSGCLTKKNLKEFSNICSSSFNITQSRDRGDGTVNFIIKKAQHVAMVKNAFMVVPI